MLLVRGPPDPNRYALGMVLRSDMRRALSLGCEPSVLRPVSSYFDR